MQNYKHLVICYIRYVYSDSMKMLGLYHHKLVGNIEQPEGKYYLLIGDLW